MLLRYEIKCFFFYFNFMYNVLLYVAGFPQMCTLFLNVLNTCVAH